MIVMFVFKRLKILRLEYREKKFLAKQSEDQGRYKVLRHVTTQADMEDHEGEVCEDVCLCYNVCVGRAVVCDCD